MVLLRNPKADRTSRDGTILIQDCKTLVNGNLLRASVLVRDGKIAKVARRIFASPEEQKINAANLLVIPGLVDAHVHLRDMDLSHKEDFTSGTSAAAAGGVTTVIDMPNTLPPTDSLGRLREKMTRARDRILVNVGFHAAAVSDQSTIAQLGKAGAFSLKLYVPKPISPFEIDDNSALSKLMRTAAQNKLPLTVHAEEAGAIRTGAREKIDSFNELAAGRPPQAETLAVSRILGLRASTKCAVHFCHLTLLNSLAKIENLEASRVTSEVTPHHLLLSRRCIDEKQWKAWMVPPLRSETERRNLLSATTKGFATTIASDHAPHTVSEKMNLPSLSPPGIPGLETTLPLLLTLVSRGKIALSRIIELTSHNPARVFGLRSKGRLALGMDGDLVLVNLKKKSRINPETFHSKAKYSPFEGIQTQGVVHTTIVAGSIVYSEGEIIGTPGTGKVLVKE